MKPLSQHIPALQFQFVKSWRHTIMAITELTTPLRSYHGSGTPCGCHETNTCHAPHDSSVQAQPYHGSGTPCGCHASTSCHALNTRHAPTSCHALNTRHAPIGCHAPTLHAQCTRPFAHPRYVFVYSLLLLLALAVSACSLPGIPAPTSQGTPTPTGGTTPVTTSPPQVLLGVQPCPDAVKTTTYWDPIIPTNATSKVESVSCANLMGIPTLQALVTVRNQGTGGILDVYVYDNITNPQPTQIFKKMTLAEGDAKISGYNSVLTAEVDAASSINKGKPDAQLTKDLFREYKWSDAAGTLVQIGFPGIYPDLTRFQAEADQAKVNQGQDFWKTNVTKVANNLALNMLKWPTASSAIVSGGGPGDTNAVVTVSTGGTPNQHITVTLSRLEGNTNGGIWEVTSVQLASTPALTAPKSLAQIASPVTVTGNHNGFEGVAGTVSILDHLYTDIGHAMVNSNTAAFSVDVTYTSSVSPGTAEEGVVVFFPDNASGSPEPVEMVKVLIGA